MKTILLILFVACASALAQTPAITDSTDPATRDAIMRNALRTAMGLTNSNTVTASAPVTRSPAVPPAAATPSSTPPTIIAQANPPALTNRTTPAFPAFPTLPAAGTRGRPRPTRADMNAAAANAVKGANVPPLGTATETEGKSAETIIPPGDIDFPAVSIEQVLPIYAELVGRTILRAQIPPITISLKTQTALTKTEAIQAFDSVLAMNGITMINVGDKFVKAVPMNLAAAQAVPFGTNSDSEIPESDQYITHITQLQYAKPSEVVPVLTPLAQIPNSILAIDSSGILIIRDYASNVKRMLELIKQIDVTAPSEYDSEVIPIKYAQAQDIASALSSLSGGGGGGTTIGHSGGGGTHTGTTGGLGGLGGGIGGGIGGSTGYGGSSGFGGSTGLGGSTGATGGRTSSFTDRLNQVISKAAGQGDFQVLGKTKIIADQRTNSLLVFASKEDMAMIKKIVNQLDVVLAQVLIEAIIMEVTLDNSQSVGVSYNQLNPSQPGNYFSGIGGINNGTFLNQQSFAASAGSNLVSQIPGGLSYAAQFGGDFDATITAIAANDRINVLSRPTIQTSHGVAASLQVGDTVPEVSGTYFGGINGQASSQYQQTFVGINLQVTPLINPDGLVVMDILQDVQQLGPSTIIDGNPVPTTSKRTAQATVSVRDRDTIILGGMISTSKSTSRSGVPFLKDIPGLGYLFRSTVDSSKRVELIVLIRPTVLPTPEAAALVAAHRRDKMPGIKAAEREERLDANERLKQSDKLKMPKETDY
ncbi:MAG TPA: secretin N-terminal domain-containing protein [Verrucomicrobiae bacterium]|nr:secretin N-terminal domain-containing protein [Verrucomicrobiae bacterium]